MLLVNLWGCTFVVDMIHFINTAKKETCQYAPGRLWGLFVIICFNILPFCAIAVNYSVIWITAAGFAFKEKERSEHFETKKELVNAIAQAKLVGVAAGVV